MACLMDSNAFIESKNHFYRFSFCPGFWDRIALRHAAAELFSVEMVSAELAQGNDELANWAANDAPAGFFVAASSQVVTTQTAVARWVNAQPMYAPAEKARFLGKADPWLVAEAIVNGYEIVTFEDLVPANSSKVKIPNVAASFGVKCVSLFDVLEASGALLKI